MRGALPLRETVLPKLDMQLDKSQFMPILRLHEPERTEWSLLSYFGASGKTDVHYYLQNLVALIRDQNPDTDMVGYLYEQIQSRYTGQEKLIRAAFYTKDIVLVKHDGRDNSHQESWMDLHDCVAKNIDIMSMYNSCSYLFRCLLSPSGDPVGGLVHAMTMINPASSLQNITRLFRELSKTLGDNNSSKTMLLLKPLQGKAIFPITKDFENTAYDALSTAHDNTWFIADNSNLSMSFRGMVPLLAISVQDLSTMESLLQALKVDSRKISKNVKIRTRVVGHTRSNFRYTDRFRLKSPFINALIPRDHLQAKSLRRQVSQLRVHIADRVLQTFTLTLPHNETKGNPIPGYVSVSCSDNSMTLTMTEETAAAECPPHELVSTLALRLGIREQHHMTLLLTALGRSSLKSINAAFLRHGIKVDGLMLDSPNLEEDLLHPVGAVEELLMPPPFLEDLEYHSDAGSNSALQVGSRFEGYEDGSETGQDADGRIPMVPRIKGVGNTYSTVPLDNLEAKEDEFIECNNMQFLGENMVARLLEVHLGTSFDPARDWTSELRERAGLTYVPEDSSIAPFTLSSAETRSRMTDFLVRYGASQHRHWHTMLKRTSPTYHVDVLVSGDSAGTFVMEAKWLERFMRLKLPPGKDDEFEDVNVLIHVTHAYSENHFAFDVVVDPWQLLYDGKLKFTRNWLMQGTLSGVEADQGKSMPAQSHVRSSLEENTLNIPDQQKQLVLFKKMSEHTGSSSNETGDGSDKQIVSTLYLPWSQRDATGILSSEEKVTHTSGRRSLYTYKPLLHGYIRLLYLLPGAGEAPLQAAVNHIACNYAGRYQALSYVWGSSTTDKELITPNGIVLITASLHNALLALRQKDQAIMLWVDAVCINQADTKEKAQQIRLMAEIFQACECAYAFLSEGSQVIDRALKMLMQMRAKKIREERRRPPEDTAVQTDSRWEGGNLPPPGAPIWTSMKELFTLPYFRRAWIIQEVVAAHKVKIVCGDWVIEWKDLCSALEIVDLELQIADYGERFDKLRASWEPFMKLAAQREWEARLHRWSLLKLLENFRHAESTLKRDRLFALVGLASDGNEAEFEPDYDSDFSAIVVRFAEAFVRQGRGLQLLYRAGNTDANQDPDPKLPSWIPDWTSKRPIGLHDPSDPDATFSACGAESAQLTLGPLPGELSVDGYEMDIITQITSTSNEEANWAAYFHEIDQMISNSVLSDMVGPKEKLKWQVPIAAAPYSSEESYHAFRTHLANPFGISTEKDHDQKKSTHKSYASCLQGTLDGWRFVITERGLSGVVPALSRVGDTVAVMKGGCVPFVLREENEKWKLVGECYVHGIMKGEGLGQPGIKEMTFCLH